MMQGSLTERITRSLAYMLRHQPEEFDLELDRQGFGDMSEVVCALNERLGEPIEDGDVEQAIDSGDRPRYEIVDGRIRALYGHSFEIDPGETAEPPELLYVGVGSRDAERAERQGLRSGRRAFLHLALTYEDAQEMGRRVAPDYAVITVSAAQACEDGVAFYDRKSLFLSEEIPTEFLEVGDTHHDGVRRDTRGRGRRGGRPGPDGGGGRERVRGRGGRHDRDDQRDRDRGPREHDRDRDRDRADRIADRSVLRKADEPVRKPEPVAQPDEPRRAESRPRPDEGFGDGIFEAAAAEKKRSAKAPEPSAEPEAAPAPEPEHEPSATHAPEASEPEPDLGSGFGEGIL